MEQTLIKRKKQNDYMKDADYIRLIKDESTPEEKRQEYKYELYHKYLPLILKMSKKFNLSKEDTEDYISEAFFVVVKVIDYTDVERIDDNYSFGYFLRFNLMNKGIQGVKKSVRRESKIGTKISWDAVVDGGNYRPEELMVPEEEAFSDSEVFNQKRQVMHTLTQIPEQTMGTRDKRIMRCILQGFNCKEVSDRFGISQQRILKIKKKGIEILQNEITQQGH